MGGLRPRPSTVGTHLVAIPRGEDPHPQCRKGCGPVFQSLSFRTSKPSREVSWLLDTTSDRRPWAPPAHSAPGAPRRPTELVSHGLFRHPKPFNDMSWFSCRQRMAILVPFPTRCVYHRPNVSPALLITS